MGTRVYIGGLPYRVKERDIERFFRGYGKLREVLIKNGYGFVVSCQFDSQFYLKLTLNHFCRNLKTIVMLTMLFTNLTARNYVARGKTLEFLCFNSK